MMLYVTVEEELFHKITAPSIAPQLSLTMSSVEPFVTLGLATVVWRHRPKNPYNKSQKPRRNNI